MTVVKNKLQLEESRGEHWEQRASQMEQELKTVHQELDQEREQSRVMREQYEQAVQKLESELREQRSVIQQQRANETQKSSLITNHVNDLKKKTAKILECETVMRDQSQELKTSQEEIARLQSDLKTSANELNDLRQTWNELNDEVKKQKSIRETMNNELQGARARNLKLQQDIQAVERDARTYYAKVQELEKKLNEQQAPMFVPVKFESDILHEMASRRRNEFNNHQHHHHHQSNHINHNNNNNNSNNMLLDVVKLIQVTHFFDTSKPDGMEMRRMFISDQNGLRADRKFTLLNSLNDFGAFDHMCAVLKGSSSGQQRPNQLRVSAISESANMIHKILSRHGDEIIPGVTFKVLEEQIVELQTSNVFLTGRTLYPYDPQTHNHNSNQVPLGYSSSNHSSVSRHSDTHNSAYNYRGGFTMKEANTDHSATMQQQQHPIKNDNITSDDGTPLYLISGSTDRSTKPSLGGETEQKYPFDSVGIKFVGIDREEPEVQTVKQHSTEVQDDNASKTLRAPKQKRSKKDKVLKSSQHFAQEEGNSSRPMNDAVLDATAPELPHSEMIPVSDRAHSKRHNTKKKPILVSIDPVAPEAPLSPKGESVDKPKTSTTEVKESGNENHIPTTSQQPTTNGTIQQQKKYKKAHREKQGSAEANNGGRNSRRKYVKASSTAEPSQ